MAERVDTVIYCGSEAEVLAVTAAVLADADTSTRIYVTIEEMTFRGAVSLWEVDLDGISLDLANRLASIREQARRG